MCPKSRAPSIKPAETRARSTRSPSCVEGERAGRHPESAQVHKCAAAVDINHRAAPGMPHSMPSQQPTPTHQLNSPHPKPAQQLIARQLKRLHPKPVQQLTPTCSAERSTLPGDTVPEASREEVASRLRSVSLTPACEPQEQALLVRAVRVRSGQRVAQRATDARLISVVCGVQGSARPAPGQLPGKGAEPAAGQRAACNSRSPSAPRSHMRRHSCKTQATALHYFSPPAAAPRSPRGSRRPWWPGS